METLIKNKKGVSFQIVKRDKQKKIAVLKQVTNITKCLMFGGQYSFVKGSNSKDYLTLDAALELYNSEL